MALRFYNTLSQQIETFSPARDNTVRMYTCGPTVYRYAHIGNLRTFLLADLVRRGVLAPALRPPGPPPGDRQPVTTLRGLLDHERTTGGSEATRRARRIGEGYLLERRLLYRRSTGELVGPWATRAAASRTAG